VEATYLVVSVPVVVLHRNRLRPKADLRLQLSGLAVSEYNLPRDDKLDTVLCKLVLRWSVPSFSFPESRLCVS
jgi:hypothetical protein